MSKAGLRSLRALPLFAWVSAIAALLLCATTAAAAGRIEWKKKAVDEREGGSWQLELAIYMPKAPDVAHVPMRFTFTPTVYYERTLVDGQTEPQMRRVPLQNRQPNVESVDVGFLDPGTGVIQSRTRFSFKVTRGHGYEAGEYQVKVTDSRSNATIGTPTTITLNGENEVIDRRSMVFSGEKKKKKSDEESEAAASEPEEEKKELTPEDDAYWKGGPTEEADGPPPEHKKPGGCGCRVGGTSEAPAGSWAAVLVVGLAALRLSRRRA